MKITWTILGFTLLAGCNGQLLHVNSKKAPNSPATVKQPITELNKPLKASVPEQPAATRAIKVVAKPATPPKPADIWHRIRKGFRLPDRDHARVKNDLKWYVRHPEYIERVMERAEPFLHLIVTEIKRRGIPTEIALLPVVESAFKPFAYSHGRAAGLWQFIPSTGRRFGLKQNWWYDGRRDVLASTRAALDLLQHLHKRFKGDWLLALAAYNSGGGTVSKAVRRNKRLGRKTDFWHLRLPRETRGYVPKLLALSEIISAPAKYDIKLRAIPDKPRLARVNVGSQIDLALVARLTDMDIRDIYRLNPAFNRWATDPAGPHYLLIPVDRLAVFKKRFAQLPARKRITWKRHRIRQGESLIVIAKRYRTSVKLIKRINRIRGHNIRAGRYLVIPVARMKLARYAMTAEQRLKRIKRKGKGYRFVHTVQDGDNLWDISRTYRVSVRRLAKWNGLAPRDRIRPGQKLVIWRKRPPRRARRTKTALGSNPLTTIQPVYYTVHRGDSLARIASKFKVTIAQLKRWNRIRSRYLQPGQRLTVYVDITRQTGSI
jgi:membrane-bound lytic murein transglycosylase D